MKHDDRNAPRRDAHLSRRLAIALVTASFALSPAFATESKKKEKEAKEKAQSGASCKAPAAGPCGSCAVTCAPGEAARCAPGQVSGNMCHIQASCRCGQ